MQPFLTPDIFPLEIFSALRKYMANPAASSCTDVQLLRMLKLHDEDLGSIFIENLPIHTLFLYNNRLFKKGEKVRKRYKCLDVEKKSTYLFNPLAEVELFEDLTSNFLR